MPPLDAALNELIFEPLRMTDTTFHVQGEALQRLVRPSSNDPDPWIFEWLNVTKPPKRFSGAGGLASTAADYYRVLQMLSSCGVLDGTRVLSPTTVRWAMADHIGNMRGPLHPGDGYSWNLFNAVRIEDGRALFPGSVGDIYWGGITGPRYFVDPRERLIGILFFQAPSQRTSYQAGAARHGVWVPRRWQPRVNRSAVGICVAPRNRAMRTSAYLATG